ncbi:hypothetical protein C6P42_001464, partial [Pichia californica]
MFKSAFIISEHIFNWRTIGLEKIRQGGILQRRYNGSISVDYFSMFPKTFPSGKTSPGCGFTVDLKKLRKEYRKLQSLNHPDLNNDLNNSNSN